ncbi:MAG: general secretion pathway protein GspB [Oceanobacter sp.]
MSYILDALKKSEQQKRERDGASGVDMTPLMMTAAPVAEAPRLPWLVWAMAVALIGLMASVAVLLWLPAENSEPTAPVVEPSVVAAPVHTVNPVVVSPEVVKPAVTKPAAVQPKAAKIPEPAPRLITPSVPKTPPPEPVAARAKIPEFEKVAEIESVAEVENSDEAERVGETSRPGVERRLLPPLTSLRKIPDLIITSHIYSVDASTRSVSMNGRNWHEGSWIAPGVTLDKITETGILLDVEGFPFPVHRQNGWQSIAE